MAPKSTDVLIAEIHTDMKWVKSTLIQKANKWTEKVLGVLMVGIGMWVIDQLLSLVETAKAIF